ncbi:MAG: hypothetical protein EZS28_014587 [Streblomastix strix]|uniref:Uncharacterized protein n=1 Tax=Streblomastix strix TaxID=222440 RepID=A0A5J4W5B5_9EUKA|nr:MAG: hypothetical protein EZS28_014587 [Streblomastix strix]
MTHASGQNAQVLFTHLRDRSGLVWTSNEPLIDYRDANVKDTNVSASNCEITKINADARRALKKMPMQEIQFFIMRILELLTGQNAFAIDFWASSIALAQIPDYKAQTLHASKVTRHVDIPSHQVLNNATNS